jgi:uncharacterized protein (TIGR02284 family)
MNNKHCIDICNSLLRGERSAVETYDQALEKYREKPVVVTELTRIRSEHEAAVRVLESNVRSMGGEPDESSGPWGSVAAAVQATAGLFGAGSALESLQQGEKSGKRDYEKALDDDEVMPECKSLIQTKLLPPVEEHVIALEALQKAA